MKRNPLLRLLIVLIVFAALGFLLRVSYQQVAGRNERVTAKNSILHLELTGVIMNGKKFLKNLKKYSDDKNVKAILISIDSPGGAVGPSQELNSEIKRVREATKKPVVCVSTGVMASGAYYAGVACDQLVVAPGAMVGSIGVIMSFANFQKLYDWAHVDFFSITSGKFKDSGAEYRPMRDDEKALFQDMINEVYAQFKTTVMNDRKLKEDVVTAYADGRVFTGAKAVELGFADQVGTFEDAVKLAADKAGLGDDYDLFEIPKPRRSLWDWDDDAKDPVNSVSEAAKDLLHLKTMNKPMYLMPGSWE